MGKPYLAELALLQETYSWALAADVTRVATAIDAAARLPLLAVGSGGSFTVAEFGAQLHRRVTASPAWAQTPLEAVTSGLWLRSMAVLMATAGGSHPDVLGSFERLARSEPGRMIALCLRVGSPLSRLAARFPSVDVVEFASPAGRDGFLATNSLLASAVLLARAYETACGATLSLPRWKELVTFEQEEVDSALSRLWERRTLIVLFGPTTRAAAVDLESKFTEAALGNVSIADYRQFAHGRHYWLAKHPSDTAVLALVAPEDRTLASRTLAILPRSVPSVRYNLRFPGVTGAIETLSWVLHAVASAGRVRHVDPGRPGVPPFGRRVYHLNAFPSARASRAVSPNEDAAIERKARVSVEQLQRAGTLDLWRKAYAAFVASLRRAHFCGVVLDYDGTLCSEAERFGELRTAVCREIERLVRMGVAVGVATGRGKSVRVALRKGLPPCAWDRVVVGYYNGADVAPLSDDVAPDASGAATRALRTVAAAVRQVPLLSEQATIEVRPLQVTIVPQRSAAEWVWNALTGIVQALPPCELSLLRSSHSFDIVARPADKRAVIERVRSMGRVGSGDAVLAIGDRGLYPGNDHLLLATPHALSVDDVSATPHTCWNVAPVGFRGVDAALYYLASLRMRAGDVIFAPRAHVRHS